MNEPIKVSDWSQKYKLGLYVLGLIMVGYFGYQLLQIQNDGNKLKGIVGITITHASSTVGTTATKILSLKSGTQMRTISYGYIIGTSTLWLHFQATSTGVAVNQGYPLTPSTTLRMCDAGCDLPLWEGEIWGIMNTGTSTVSTIDG